MMIMEFSVKWIIDSIQKIRPCLIGRTKNEHVQSHSMIQSPTGLTAKGSLINYHHILQDILSTLCLFSCCPTESPLIIAFEGGSSDDNGCIISFYVYSGQLYRPLGDYYSIYRLSLLIWIFFLSRAMECKMELCVEFSMATEGMAT